MRNQPKHGLGAGLVICLSTLFPPAAWSDTPANNSDSTTTNAPRSLRLLDVFDLEWAGDPQIAADGSRVVYVRNFMDIQNDRRRSTLWLYDLRTNSHQPLTSGDRNDSSPRWSPSGDRIVHVSSDADGSTQIFCRWLDSGRSARLGRLPSTPAGISWSPDGRWLAFTMHVETKKETFVELPGKPEDADWAPAATVIRSVRYRYDGAGYLKSGHRHLFVLATEGGTPRRLTNGEFEVQGTPSWTPDSKAIVFTSNREVDWEYDPRNTELYEVGIADGNIRALTTRAGPDLSPAVSPDGRRIAYLGFDDRLQGYQVTRLYVMDRETGSTKSLTANLDRTVRSPLWSADSQRVYFLYDDHGRTRIGAVGDDGVVSSYEVEVGTSLGRPYPSGSFSIARDGTIAYTASHVDRPAELALLEPSGESRQLTELNADFTTGKQFGELHELWAESSHDGRRIQGWLLLPPNMDASKNHPLILEIHGGPFSNYGPRFTMELQLYAAAGYVVLYTNPRGSTSYGGEFGNLIHHAYPGNDYDDLMSCVDAALEKGFVDPQRLYVTGGSGGGVLSSWIVGHTNRFRAAVVAKPVINWYSFALTADGYPFFYKYWFPGLPWNHLEHYMKRSPISYVGNVTTPTMLLTGEEDYRTPMSETEQYYQALKLRKVDAAMVRIPGASHSIAARPSHLMSKVAHILKWFELYK